MQGILRAALSRGFPLSRRGIPTVLASRPCFRSQSVTTFCFYRSLSSLPNIPLFCALQNHDRSSLAVAHSASPRSFTYGNLVADVLRAQQQLRESAGGRENGLSGERIAFLAENSYDYVGTVFLLKISSPDLALLTVVQ